MSSFKDLRMLSLCLVIQRGMRLGGYCELKPLNLEKTTSRILSIMLLIYAFSPVLKDN